MANRNKNGASEHKFMIQLVSLECFRFDWIDWIFMAWKSRASVPFYSLQPIFRLNNFVFSIVKQNVD